MTRKASITFEAAPVLRERCDHVGCTLPASYRLSFDVDGQASPDEFNGRAVCRSHGLFVVLGAANIILDEPLSPEGKAL